MPDGMRRRAKAHDPVNDHGPQILQADASGKLVPALHPRLEVVDGADPAAPARTVRRARARCHYDAAWRQGRLSDAEREAADRYAQTQERFMGARERHDGPSEASLAWTKAPPLTQLQASASLTDAHKAIGNGAAGLLLLYVRDNLKVEDIAHRRGENPTLCMGRIRAALSRLAEHWGMK